MEKVDDSSDVYSLGAVLYELLSGQCPYAGKSQDEVLKLLPATSPEPIEKLARGLDDGIVLIIRKAMQREKGRRYAKASAMADDLQRFIDWKPLAPEPYGAGVLPFWTRVKRMLSG
jgi:serine/threonine protein kinase